MKTHSICINDILETKKVIRTDGENILEFIYKKLEAHAIKVTDKEYVKKNQQLLD